jgi:glutamyl-tRNA reductase
LFLRSLLESAPQLDLLVIGYSGLDRQVLDLAGSAQKVRRMTVVNRTGEEAEQVLERFRQVGVAPIWPNVVDGDFASWADGGGLNELVEEYDGPFR